MSLLKQSSSKVELFDKIANFLKERDHVDYFMEKTPEHALVLDSLLKWYPHSKFLFVLRDGRDAYSSAFRNPSVYNKVGDEYPRMWRDTARSYMRSRNAGNLILVKYEQLVCDPRGYVSNIMNFIGLPFEEKQLDPTAFSRTSMRKQRGHEMLSEKISARSIGTFRTRLSEQQIHYFEKRAGAELRALGYCD